MISSLLVIFSLYSFTGSTNFSINSSLASCNLNSSEYKYFTIQPIGAEAAKADQSLTLADMLTYAIQDEYLARARYQLVVEKFGAQRPFTNIIEAEYTHISALTPLFEKYNVPIPVDNARDYSKAPASLRESFEAGVKGEIENIAMYNRFLGQNVPEDVRNVFTRLRNASQNHLKAFQKGLSR
jgi:hypothetical protein